MVRKFNTYHIQKQANPKQFFDFWQFLDKEQMPPFPYAVRPIYV